MIIVNLIGNFMDDLGLLNKKIKINQKLYKSFELSNSHLSFPITYDFFRNQLMIISKRNHIVLYIFLHYSNANVGASECEIYFLSPLHTPANSHIGSPFFEYPTAHAPFIADKFSSTKTFFRENFL